MKRHARTLAHRSRRFWGDRCGAVMLEYALVLPLFLLLLFALVDFGRYGSDFVMTQKALERGVRLAAVRPPACPGVPETHARVAQQGGGTTPPRFGTPCRFGAVCADPGTISCGLDLNNVTARAIWDRIRDVVPNTVEPAEVTVSYSFDERLGFLGGPYVPLVTLELTGASFDFVTPLAGLAVLAAPGSLSGSDLGGRVPFPNMSVTLPAEDLALGSAG